MNGEGIITLAAIILILLIIYVVMKAKSSSIKRKMDERSRFRRHR
jgi:hypothetical protein